MHSHKSSKYDLTLLVFFIFLFLNPIPSMADNSGEKIFEQRCHRCHDLPDPSAPPEMGWEKRLKIMAKLAKLTPEQKKEVLVYLQSHSKSVEETMSLSAEKQLFEKKCSLCHTLDRIFIEPLTDASRSHIVKRMREKNQQWISMEESRQILDYLGKAPKIKREKRASGNAQAIFLERCSACHTLDRIYEKLKTGNNLKAWTHTVQRMQNKAPEWLSKDDAKQVIEYLGTLEQK